MAYARTRVMRAGILALLAILSASPATAQEGGGTLHVVGSASHILAVTGKRGLLSFLGHRHAILAPIWTASIRYDPEHRDRTRVDVSIDVESLRVDTAEARQLAGLDADGPDADDVEVIRGKMLGERYLDAADHPQITFRTVAARYAYDTLVVGGPLTIRGHSRDTNVQLEVMAERGGYRVTGAFQVRLTDYGMEPETVGGVVSVADEVEIRLDVLVVPDGDSRNDRMRGAAVQETSAGTR